MADEPEDLAAPGADWPPRFPHPVIDELVAQLREQTTADPAATADLLARVAQEAQRLRSTVVRLSAEKLSRADEEARTILADAVEQAHALRRLGLQALNDRLDESERLMAGTRAAVASQLGAAEVARGSGATRGPAGAREQG